MTEALDKTKECIDNYFETEISNWNVLSAEKDFTLEIGENKNRNKSNKITDKIDAVCQDPN